MPNDGREAMRDPDHASSSVETDNVRTAVVKSVRRVYSGFLSIDEAVVSYPSQDGTRRTVKRQSVERGDSIAVALVNRQRRTIWLTEQFRYSTLVKDSGWIIETPAGTVEDDESHDQAAVRETYAETGFTVPAFERAATFYVSPGGTSERITLYYASVDGLVQDLPGGIKQRDADEDIKLIEKDLDAFLTECQAGLVDDGKTLVAGLWILANRARLAV